MATNKTDKPTCSISEKKMLTIPEASTLFNVGKTELYTFCGKEGLKCLRFGRGGKKPKILIEPNVLRKYLVERFGDEGYEQS